MRRTSHTFDDVCRFSSTSTFNVKSTQWYLPGFSSAFLLTQIAGHDWFVLCWSAPLTQEERSCKEDCKKYLHGIKLEIHLVYFFHNHVWGVSVCVTDFVCKVNRLPSATNMSGLTHVVGMAHYSFMVYYMYIQTRNKIVCHFPIDIKVTRWLYDRVFLLWALHFGFRGRVIWSWTEARPSVFIRCILPNWVGEILLLIKIAPSPIPDRLSSPWKLILTAISLRRGIPSVICRQSRSWLDELFYDKSHTEVTASIQENNQNTQAV